MSTPMMTVSLEGLSGPYEILFKGPSEKRRLTQYGTNTTLDDHYKGTTEHLYYTSMNSLDN